MNRACSLAVGALLVVTSGCKREAPEVETSAAAATAALPRTGPAPEDAAFLAESGIVTTSVTSRSKLSGEGTGTLVMKFDHWGKRQSLSGDNRLAASVSLYENGQRGIVLETHQRVSGGPLDGTESSGRVTSIEWNARIPEAELEIPADVEVQRTSAR